MEVATPATTVSTAIRSARKRHLFSPPRVLALSIAGFILAGTFLLWLPLSAAPGRHTSLLDALFTATSAVCVTGLIVQDTPIHFSTFGHVVILILIQAGGLGYMTISTVLAAALGRSVTLQERLTLQEGLNVQGLDGLLRFALTVLKFTLAFELGGAALLTLRWWSELGPGDAVWYGFFHAVSAFNNAGFALWSDSLMRWRGDWAVNLVITGLVIGGGLGFFVLTELLQRHRRARLSVHTRLVLASTVLLLVTATLAMYALEVRNPATLGALPEAERWLAAWFQAVTPRTAGFNTLDYGAMTPPALFLTMALMFIGASPGSTGGGVKTTTFGITVAALWATVRGDDEPHIFGRRLSAELVARAFFVSLIAFLALNTVAGLVLVSEGRDLLRTLFETTSAFGTVGLSMGEGGAPVSLTGFFSPTGKVLVMVMMFVGRLGPLTLAFAVARRASVQPRLRYPEGKVLIG
ncbi:MAG: TrkH family potassium uptake protein [Vicinamibacterales bacterium]